MKTALKDIRRANLRRFVTASGMEDARFAEKHGINKSYLSQLMLGTCSFGEKAARALEQKFRMSPLALDDLVPQTPRPIEVWDTPADLPDGVFALIPRVGIELAAGSGITSAENNNLPPLAFREDWIRRKNVSSRGNLRVCEVRGDSMEPYLEHGDSLLIDTGQKDIVDNEVYAIAYGDELRIKRLSKRFDGGLFVRSDNPKYPVEIVNPPDMEYIKVIGRLLWRGG